MRNTRTLLLFGLLLQIVVVVAWSTASKPIPITVLAGFLGSGKTSLLQHLLQNKQGLRIAVIVNDVASVNIDSKLVASSPETDGAAGMVELQNGCACCSLSEELLTSVSELVTLSDLKGEDAGFHHIVIELSGVADPKSVRSKFQEAVLYDMPLMERTSLDTMVTVVDCSVFLEHLASSSAANPGESPQLFYRDGKAPPKEESCMEDVPGPLLEALMAGQSAYANMETSENGVPELLVSQTETADVVLLNKVDLVDSETLGQIEQIVRALNPRASIRRTEFGQVNLENILGVAKGQGVVEAGIVDDHRDAVDAVSIVLDTRSNIHEAGSDPSHSHAHSHDHDCHDPSCTDPTHSHSHDHSCSDPDCTDTSHSHSHAHDNHDQECNDPDCTDPTHTHSHSHDHHAGIGSFVFRARRPFHPTRLLSFLRYLPVVRGLPADEEGDASLGASNAFKAAMKNVLRSKGFTWCADSNIAAMYWSHAGTSFDLQCLGRWWATLPKDQWPPEAVATLLADFDDPNHNEENTEALTVGDRRQEIVFIGPGLGDQLKQQCLCESLDQCLLTDSEWNEFQSKKRNEQHLRAAFVNPISARVVSY